MLGVVCVREWLLVFHFSCSNAWHKPSVAIGAVFTFLSSVKVLHPLLRCRFLKLCLALVTVVESVFRRADVGIKR